MHFITPLYDRLFPPLIYSCLFTCILFVFSHFIPFANNASARTWESRPNYSALEPGYFVSGRRLGSFRVAVCTSETLYP